MVIQGANQSRQGVVVEWELYIVAKAKSRQPQLVPAIFKEGATMSLKKSPQILLLHSLNSKPHPSLLTCLPTTINPRLSLLLKIIRVVLELLLPRMGCLGSLLAGTKI